MMKKIRNLLPEAKKIEGPAKENEAYVYRPFLSNFVTKRKRSGEKNLLRF
jgi:hypothetical protein